MIWNDQNIGSFIVGCMATHIVDRYGELVNIWLLKKSILGKIAASILVIYMISFQGEGAGINHLPNKVLKYAQCFRAIGWGTALIWIELLSLAYNQKDSPKTGILTWMGEKLSPYIRLSLANFIIGWLLHIYWIS